MSWNRNDGKWQVRHDPVYYEEGMEVKSKPIFLASEKDCRIFFEEWKGRFLCGLLRLVDCEGNIVADHRCFENDPAEASMSFRRKF